MAGIDGAGVNELGESGGEKAGGGLLSTQARAQYSALALLRWQVFVNGLRSRQGTFELGARTVAFVLYGTVGLGLGACMGAVAYLLASDDQWQFLPILFWMVCLLWQVVPVMLASFQEQFDLSSILRFPVRFGSFFFLYVVFGLSDVSTVLGTLCCLGIWAGITMARPELFALTALVLGIFAGFNILMVRAIFAWIDRWLAQRKTREILGAIFMVLILSVQLFNPALHQKRHQGPINPEERAQSYNRLIASPWLKTANAVQQWLPPGLAALALRQSVTQQSTQALGSLGVLGLYVLGAGAVLALRVRGEYRGENLGAAPSVKKAVPKKKRADASERIAASGHIKATSGEDKWHLSVPGVIAAILDKEFRSLFRTLPLLYSIGAPLLLVLVFSGAFIRGGAPQGHMFRLALPLCMVYAQLGFMRLFFNNLGTEGPGIQLYFLSPTPIRTVLLAKNLFHSLLFGFAIVMAGVLATLRLGRPDGVVVAATIAWLLFALPCNLVVGNVFSLTMPYRVNPGRISRQRGSQANGFLTLLVQAAILAVGATVFGICLIVDRLWLAVPVFLVLSAVAVLVWMRMLRNANDMANNRKDLLIATLMKTE